MELSVHLLKGEGQSRTRMNALFMESASVCIMGKTLLFSTRGSLRVSSSPTLSRESRRKGKAHSVWRELAEGKGAQECALLNQGKFRKMSAAVLAVLVLAGE